MTDVGECHTPSLATAAYATVMSRGVTPCEPRVIEQGTGSPMGEVMPSDSAVCATRSGLIPGATTNCAKTVLTECAVALASEK